MCQPPVDPGKVTPEQLKELKDAVHDVRGWLDLKMRSGQYSFGFVFELARHLMKREYNVHTIYDEIGILEGTDGRPSATKATSPFLRPPLQGLWHKHHHQARFIWKNLELESRRAGVMEKIFAPYYGREMGEVAGQIAHGIVMENFFHRSGEKRLTGEFIVYERRGNGSNFYLTLGNHGEYDAIRARVDIYRQVDHDLRRAGGKGPA
jgi:hypothetical protein